MDYTRFKEDFKEALQDTFANRRSDIVLTFNRVEKMNDRYDAVTVKPADSAIGVNISLEKAFSEYEKGIDIDEIVDRFADAAEKALLESPQFDVSSLYDYEQMKNKLAMEVVSAERNSDLLQKVPHENLEDMAVVYRFVLDQTNSGNGTPTILITNQMLDQYGISQEQLRADALESAPKTKPVEIKSIFETLGGMIPKMEPEDEQMFVASTSDNSHGAGVIAYPNFMENAAQKLGCSFFILPSSIHEVLLVKDNGQMTAKELENMVKEINATQVDLVDQLTDNVYHYDCQNHIFESAEKYEKRQLTA